MRIFKLPNIYKKASDIVNQCEEGYFSVIDEMGYPKVATRSNVKPLGIMGGYFSSGTSGHLIQSIRQNPKSSVCFHKGADNITLIGVSEIVEDLEMKKMVWVDWFINHFTKGIEDPEYGVVRFKTERVSMWIDQQVYQFEMDEIRQVTSRCGLMCNSCEWKEPNQCTGCIESNGMPFYGTCKIAACAQAKGLTHCGECSEMPCEDLKDYSCGHSEHSDHPKGARLDVLRMWTEFGRERNR